MKSSVVRDRRLRDKALKYEVRRRVLKYAQRHGLLSPEEGRYRLAKLPRSSSTTRIKRYCIHTGHSRGVLRDFKRSRTYFRKMVKQGHIPGVKSSTW
jgi:small subunit ribosomal protein S14